MIEAASFSIDRPLPSSMTAAEFGLLNFYQKYAAFSWPWSWRRTLLLSPVCLLAAASFGFTHAAEVKIWAEGFPVGWRMLVANLVLVGAGPMLGALVRRLGLKRRLEAVLVVSAIVIGMGATLAANVWAQEFHNHEMARHFGRPSPPASAPPQAQRRPSGMQLVMIGREVASVLLLWFIANGGLGLRSYFAEPRNWAEYRQRRALEALSLQRSHADLRLAVLQAQVEPHFLFNTLASVRSLIQADPGRASSMIDALSRYLRATLPRLRAEQGTPLSTLGEQFAICESYLQLMKLRMADRLSAEIDLPVELRAVAFPPLILISLVENAIKHGAEPNATPTRVVLRAKVHPAADGEQLSVEVADDGAGLHLGPGEGTGLANIRAQLLVRFGTAAALDISARETGGVVASITIALNQLRA